MEAANAVARLRRPWRSAAGWYREYQDAWTALEHGPLEGVERAYDRRVLALNALGGFGHRALPYALELLQSTHEERRADGVGLLLSVGSRGVDPIVRILDEETDPHVRDAALVAAGRLRAEAALPSLARILRDDRLDGDTRDLAAHAIESIAGRRFRDDVVAAADRWLAEREPGPQVP